MIQYKTIDSSKLHTINIDNIIINNANKTLGKFIMSDFFI